MSEETAAELKAAMRSEGEVGAADIERVMAAYYARMDPTQSLRSCGCCGVMDIPIDEALPGAPQASDVGVESFREVRLDDPILALLLYTDAENTAYDLPVPSHVAGGDFVWPGQAARGRATGRASRVNGPASAAGSSSRA